MRPKIEMKTTGELNFVEVTILIILIESSNSGFISHDDHRPLTSVKLPSAADAMYISKTNDAATLHPTTNIALPTIVPPS